MLKNEIRAEYTEYDANGGAGLVEIDICTKTLRMLADPDKCLKNVAIDCHPHCRILENAVPMLHTLANAVTNNANVLQIHYE